MVTPKLTPLSPRLAGVDHTAHPTWKLKETVEFYRDVMGLPLIHAITAKGWGREKEQHADFLHIFFDSGNGSSIAFFYYIGTEQPENLKVPRGYMSMANHTAWAVETPEDLAAWKERLRSFGVQVSDEVRHETIESIYFRDPNFYPIEITLPLRKLDRIDASDAALTVQAAMELETAGSWNSIDAMWKRKAELVQARMDEASHAA
ncbi:VOC family protein [Sphingomonas sp.]|uniref:VOC family protein n=1 Tax=Sphingomonas sp. TaxID=28214 RepID=UPI0025FE9B91|nr:VOC family protein [Sphingomonas sp.]MBV9529231.1 VOC family protein [Sphingomonas sp.]